ncbi:MAG: asparagine synthase (glutamine-hydrolyzing) [bacterium]|nr:asparagine synthase (glutamine-hydrolyzing) [Candidatus Kapabacteria bacterium]
MCGIAGILRYGNATGSPDEIERMTHAIAHRGPDGQGVMRRDGVALGHRRLAIIDLETGAQPMLNEDGNVWLTFNGEIYNYKQLTAELVACGHIFATHSDSEVIVHAYEEWGPECVKRFRGMFAFALVDYNRRRVVLARDHFGIKPLYYRAADGFVAFASELSALRQVDAPVPEGNLAAVEYFLRYQYIPTPHTIYRDTWKLPPASYLMIDFDGLISDPVRYWDIAFTGDGVHDAEQLEDVTERVIRDSVSAHLVSDVPFGVFLSGGIDSTLVAMEMARILDTPVRAFGIGFDEVEFDELAYAREAAQRCGVELVTDVVREDEALEILPSLVDHYGEPFGDTSAIPTWFVSRLARSHVPMVLSGDGGDEAFAGYDSYRTWLALPTKRKSLELLRQGHPKGAVKNLVRAMRRDATGDSRSTQWQRHIGYVDRASRLRLWRSEHRGVVDIDSSRFDESAERANDLDVLSFAQYLDYQTYLPNDILTKVDVASMYHGLEVRTPLIDHVVVEHAARVPVEYRMRSNGDGRPVGKYLLKKILSREFPESFVHRRKMGFAMPRSRWFAGNRGFRRMLEAVILDSGSPLHRLFDADELRRQIDRHTDASDNSGQLWLLLVLGIWLDQNPDVRFS